MDLVDFANFDIFLTIKKGLQPITINGHIGCIRRMLKLCQLDESEKYINNFYKSNYSYNHKINTAKAIEYYTEFLKKPFIFARPKKPKNMIKDILTEAEITTILFKCKNIREKTIISILAYSGIRNKELCNLRVRDINWGNNTLTIIRGKGLKDRLVYISGKCISTMLEYIKSFPRDNDSLLFTTLQRRNKYSSSDLRKLIKTIGKRAGITRRIYPHLLRHSLATNMLNRGANLITIKEQLGHEFITSTMIYINTMKCGIRNDYERFAPSYL